MFNTLTRRAAIGMFFGVLVQSVVLAQQGPLKPFRFRVRTKSGSVVGTTVMARDIAEAVLKTQQRYKGCEILNLYPRKDIQKGKETTRKRK